MRIAVPKSLSGGFLAPCLRATPNRHCNTECSAKPHDPYGSSSYRHQKTPTKIDADTL